VAKLLLEIDKTLRLRPGQLGAGMCLIIERLLSFGNLQQGLIKRRCRVCRR
jgi:hypothetical protein